MKGLVLSLAVLLTTISNLQAGFMNFDDIQTWVGTGSHKSGFVVDWNVNGTDYSLAWGYRWDGTVTAEQMIRDLAAANVGIYATIVEDAMWGNYITGIGFDLNQNGTFGASSPMNGSLSFSNGVATLANYGAVDSTRTATDPGDYYRESGGDSFWGYWTNDAAIQNWESSFVGISTRNLVDGSWDGFSFALTYNTMSEPGEAIAAPNPNASPVPVPAAWVLLLSGTPLLMVARRKMALGNAV
jgi:hypothetical protein